MGSVKATRLFPSSPQPPFQSEARCKVFIHIEIGLNYHNKNFALRLALKVRLRGTRKWAIMLSKQLSPQPKEMVICKHHILLSWLFFPIWKEEFQKKKILKLLTGLFLKSPETFAPISGATIPFISSQRRGSKPSNFTILQFFLTL